MLEPSGSQEAKGYVGLGLSISEQYGKPRSVCGVRDLRASLQV